MDSSSLLTEREISVLVNAFIGVESGYLRGFSYSAHEEFYPRFCDVAIDVAGMREVHGTTKRTFVAILRAANPELQAKIVEGTLAFIGEHERLPEEQKAKRANARAVLERTVSRLRGQAVMVEGLVATSETVKAAIADADLLIREHGNTSGTDRVHTALHGYLRSLCTKYGIQFDQDSDAPRLLKVLRTPVPQLQAGLTRQDDVNRLVGALGTIVDALSPIRNHASLAHPNETRLEAAEAALAIDSARTILNYLIQKSK